MDLEEKSQKIRAELMILEALVIAMDRREEIFAVIEESTNDHQTRLDVGELLGLDEVQVSAILDMQVRRFTPTQRRTIEQHIALLNEELGSLG